MRFLRFLLLRDRYWLQPGQAPRRKSEAGSHSRRAGAGEREPDMGYSRTGDSLLPLKVHSKPDSCPERSRDDNWLLHWYKVCLSAPQHAPFKINYSLYALCADGTIFTDISGSPQAKGKGRRTKAVEWKTLPTSNFLSNVNS